MGCGTETMPSLILSVDAAVRLRPHALVVGDVKGSGLREMVEPETGPLKDLTCALSRAVGIPSRPAIAVSRFLPIERIRSEEGIRAAVGPRVSGVDAVVPRSAGNAVVRVHRAAGVHTVRSARLAVEVPRIPDSEEGRSNHPARAGPLVTAGILGPAPLGIGRGLTGALGLRLTQDRRRSSV